MLDRDQKIAADYSAMLVILHEVLEHAGEAGLAASFGAANPTSVPAPPISPDAPESALQLIGVGFQLLNMVEENAAVQLRRAHEKTESSPVRGSFDDVFGRAAVLGLDRAELEVAVANTAVELVLTAHPTEARRRTMIAHYRDLYLQAVALENTVYTPRERGRIRDEAAACLERIWRTQEVHLQKPSVEAELAYVVHYAMNVFPDALHVLIDRYRRSCAEAGFGNLPMPKLAFGSWVGGDRDGHPFVNAEVTRRTLDDMRLAAVVVVRRTLQPLVERLSLTGPFTSPPASLGISIERSAAALGDAAKAVLERNRGEEFRQFVGLMLARLPVEVERGHITRLSERDGAYRDSTELLEDLRRLRAALIQVGARHLATEDVDRAIACVETFGLHLATLDIRQNSATHEKALDELLLWAGADVTSYSGLDEGARRSFLVDELRHRRPIALRGASCGPNADRVLGVYHVLAEHLRNRGGAGLGPLIVSMTREVSDLLAVYLFQREAGLLHIENGTTAADLPVVPLFETIDDLEHAPAVLEAFLSLPVTRGTLARRQRGGALVQQVMLGYSDSNKDGGIVAAQVAVERAERRLAEVGGRHGVTIEVFHGRGGSTARGGGSNEHFLHARPRSAFSGRIRSTVQGETVARELANLMTAANTLETWLAGSLRARIEKGHAADRAAELESVLGLFAERSRASYERLVNHMSFIEFFRWATPIDVLERSGIGSRPARRTGGRTLSDLRAIPWVFSWNQSRHCLPSWYGVGSSLTEIQANEPEAFERLRRATHDEPFVSNLMHNIEMGLASSHVGIGVTYASLVPDAIVRSEITSLIEREHEATSNMLDQLFGRTIIQRRPALMASIAARADALARVHHAQIDLLRSWRAIGGPFDEASPQCADLLRRLLMTVNAIAAGLRSTG